MRAALGALALLVGCGGLLWGCGKRATPPATRHPLTVAGQPRIAALSPAIAQMLHDLGREENLVARHAYDQWSEPSIPVCGEQGRIDYEALIATRPTAVLVQDATISPKLQTLAERAAFSVTNFAILSLDDIRGALHDLAGLFAGDAGVSEKEERLRAEMDRAWSPRAGCDLSKVGSVLLLAEVDPPSALGPGSFHHQLLERLGGRSATPAGGPYIVMDAEEVLRLAPDAIILIRPRPPTAGGKGGLNETSSKPHSFEEVQAMLGRLGTLDIPAMRNRRVRLIDDPMAHLPGTCMIRLADEMADMLCAWGKDSVTSSP